MPLKLALTQDYVDGLTIAPGAPGDVSIYDTERKGLFVRLRRGAGGISKTWYIGYQWRGKDRRKLLGSTAAYTLMDARDRAKGVLRDVADGNDPAAAKTKVMKTRTTFAEVAEKFIAEQRGNKRHSTFRAYERYLTGPYFKPLHDIELAKIEMIELVECMNSIRDKGVKKPSKNAASQARGSLILLYDFAQQEGWIPVGFNPARSTRNPMPRRKAVPRKRTLSDDELVAVWDAAGSLGDYGRIIRLLILLGNRREEIGGMEWDELNDGIWTLPAERNKIGHDRCIPLSAEARKLIGERPVGRKHVFGTRDLGFMSWSNGKHKLDKHLDKIEPWTVHDLRRSMRSRLTTPLGVNRDLAEKMIGHIPPKIVRTYEVEEQLGEQAAAFERWASYVAGILDGTVRRLAVA